VPDLEKISKLFGAEIDRERFKEMEKWIQLANEFPNKPWNNNVEHPDYARIFPNYWAPVMIQKKQKRVLTPMRYRLRPRYSKEEVPNQYNMFNARLDSLGTRKSWNSLFTVHHGIFFFSHFFEWVERDKKKKLIQFYPKEREFMWAPVLFDWWEHKKSKSILPSFALITGDPAPEILNAGHDRCPLFLKQNKFDEWLTPKAGEQQHFLQILEQREQVTYDNALV